ncbi:MAG: tetratricopeptide repeat protein, partial [Alphaproteobacteria bacterium]|nr:tetratricopeptide repeat protein [Alphaproteobacteria bacterium]
MNRAEKRRQQKEAQKAARKTAGNTKPAQSANRSRQGAGPTPIAQQALNAALRHQRAGRLAEAERGYQQILQADPHQPVALNLLGVLAHQLGRHDAAIDLISKAVAIQPNYPEAHYNLGTMLHELNKPDAAVASYNKALVIRPDYAEAHNNLGNALKDLGRLDEAVASCRKALALKPDYAEAHYNLGIMLQKLNKLDEAAASYNKALAIKPDFAEALNDLGNVLKDLGRLDEAVASYYQALAIKPDFAEAHRHLSIVKKFTEYDNDIQAMEQSYARPGISDEQRMLLAFGLGKAFEDLQQYEKAFGFFAEGNAIIRRSYNYSIAGHGKVFEKIEEVFDAALFAGPDSAGCNDDTPIFIVGLPRSGTTLVEQILASHPQVHGAGELELLEQIVSRSFGNADGDAFAENIRQADAGIFESLGAEYINQVRKQATKTRYITDKMPGNYFHIGLIKLALPNAKVIHCRRHPADNGLSLFGIDLIVLEGVVHGAVVGMHRIDEPIADMIDHGRWKRNKQIVGGKE